MNRKIKMFVLASFVAVMLTVGVAQATSVSATVATSADPSNNATDPLFTVDWINKTVTGGWADGKGNLDLEIPLTSISYEDVWFEFDMIAITNTIQFFGRTYGETSNGQINFYASGTTTDPLLVITFDSALVSQQVFGADDLIVAENLTIAGSAIPQILSAEQFNFSFANVTKLLNGDGFTSTASFTSSAMVPVVPEPVTLVTLMAGFGFWMFRKK